MLPWLLAIRPKTLPAAAVPVWVGNAPALLGKIAPFSWLMFWATLLSCLCIQIATNLFNDAIDAAKGADTGKRLGPQRATASGMLSPRQVMIGAFAFCVLAMLFAVPLIARHGWIPIVVGGISLLLSYAYTGGPYPLAYRGMGELFVIIFFGLVAVLGSFYMQCGSWFSFPGWVVALQIGIYSTVLIAINNLRDIEEDASSGKATLAVRFGKRFARWEIGFLCFAPLFLNFLYRPGNAEMTGILISSFLFASLITYQVFVREPDVFYNKLLGIGALQLINFAIWFSIWVWREQEKIFGFGGIG